MVNNAKSPKWQPPWWIAQLVAGIPAAVIVGSLIWYLSGDIHTLTAEQKALNEKVDANYVAVNKTIADGLKGISDKFASVDNSIGKLSTQDSTTALEKEIHLIHDGQGNLASKESVDRLFAMQDKSAEHFADLANRLTKIETRLEPLARDVDTIRTAVQKVSALAKETIREEMRDRSEVVQIGICNDKNTQRHGDTTTCELKLLKTVRIDSIVSVRVDAEGLSPGALAGTMLSAEVLGDGDRCRLTIIGPISEEVLHTGFAVKVSILQHPMDSH
jgi:hypothetical protein